MSNVLPGKERQEDGSFRLQYKETQIIDSEVLLRKTFQVDPRQGCSLLFRLYYGPLCSHVIRFVYSKQIAEDIVADIFCTFWEDGVFQKIRTSYRAYLFKSVRHSAFNYVKFELAKKANVELVMHLASSNPDEILQYDELYHLLEETINGLPHQCKNVFTLSRMENKRYQDIAMELNISVKAVEAHISKALRILHKRINLDWNKV